MGDSGIQLTDLIHPGAVCCRLDASDKAQVITQMAEALYKANSDLESFLSSDRAIACLLEREEVAGTGIGYGAAIPHAAISNLPRIYAGLATSIKEIEFNAVDHRPCQLFFLIISPSQQPRQHIKVLSRISRLLLDDEKRSSLQEAETDEALYQVLKALDV